MSNCKNCKFRATYDKNPRSMLGRIWKWHVGWCPGWKSYLKSLSEEDRMQLGAAIKLRECKDGFLGYIP
jgi:hypothetical protein